MPVCYADGLHRSILPAGPALPLSSSAVAVSIRGAYVYGNEEALIEVDTLAVVRGELPRRALALVAEWAVLHRNELRRDWDLARNGRRPEPIAPLDQEDRGDGVVPLLRIREVTPTKGFCLRLTLTDGTVVERDLTE